MIQKTYEDNGNILPSIFNLIKSIPEEQIFNQIYHLRHPKIIVYKTLKRVFSAFDNILILSNEIENEYFKTKNLTNYNFEPLQKAIMELIESINSFIEDCQHIFKSTTPPTDITKNINEKFVSIWLKKAKHPVQKSFFESIKEYRDEITYYTNNYKHEHGRIDIIPGIYENDFTIGYTMKFIGDTPSGCMEILDLNKVKTLRLEIIYHFYQFYNISEIFTKELINSQKLFHGIDIKILKFETNEFNVENLIKRMQFKDLLIFPNNDLFMPKVYIKLTPKSLNINYPFGITENNTKHIKLIKIADKPYPENSLIAIPTNKTIKIWDEFMNGDRKKDNQLELSLDDSEFFLKIFSTHKIYEKSHNFIELNYDNLFIIKSSTNIKMPIQFESEGTESKLYLKIFDIDYLGIKMTKND